MSLSMVKGNIICKCRVHNNVTNKDIVNTVIANILVTPYTGAGLNSYDLSLTDETLYIEALRKDVVGLADVAYTDIIPRKDIQKFEVELDGIKELVMIVATIRGKTETLSFYRENTKEDYLATIIQGLLKPSYVDE